MSARAPRPPGRPSAIPKVDRIEVLEANLAFFEGIRDDLAHEAKDRIAAAKAIEGVLKALAELGHTDEARHGADPAHGAAKPLPGGMAMPPLPPIRTR